MSLTAKQRRFVAEYLIDHNATQAAERAGFKGKRLDQTGYELVRKPEIAQAIAAGEARQLEDAGLTASRVLEELRRLSFSDLRSLFDNDGNLKPIQSLTAEQAACIASMEVVKRNLTAGDGQMDTIIKLKVWDKTRSLEMLAKHFALLTERVEHSGDLVVRWQTSES